MKHWVLWGLYWVELSVCIIPPIIYNLMPPWTYPVLGNHVNLLVCVLFVFVFGPVCIKNWYQSVWEARTLKKTRFSALGLKLQNFQSSQILILTTYGDSSCRYEFDDIKIIEIGVETSLVELAEVSPEKPDCRNSCLRRLPCHPPHHLTVTEYSVNRDRIFR